jgi:adenylyltransferase/sulfurtransferase
MILTPEERDRITAQAVAEYPDESCGVILVRGGERRLLQCRNQQNELHARKPAKYPRDARKAYSIHSDDLQQIGRLQEEGFDVAVIYHSHVDVGAYFSETDRNGAAPMGIPMYPNTIYVVTSVMERQVAAMAAFQWDDAQRGFAEVKDASLAVVPVPSEGNQQ